MKQDDPKGSPKSAATQPDAPAQQGSVPPQGGAAGRAVGGSEGISVTISD